jgi:hypothetical protein
MRPLKLATLCICAALSAGGSAAASAAKHCDAPAHHQFDFWLGRWQVSENGKPTGTNRIDRLLDGCALLENWVGSDASRGHSLNFYDPKRGLWQQTWVDNSAGVLNLTGRFAGGRMVLSGDSRVAGSHQKIRDRITWTPNANGSVRQLWDRSTDGGRTWQIVFDGLYTRG